MVLIIGGVYQGKLAYALKRFELSEDDVYRCSIDSIGVPGNQRIVYEIDKWILALVKEEKDTDELVSEFIAGNKGAIVIGNDISCGIVPVEPEMRIWREATGRALAEIAQMSDEVIRLFCGIPTRLK